MLAPPRSPAEELTQLANRQRIYKVGHAARLAGLAREANPFKVRKDLRLAWDCGWCDADELMRAWDEYVD